MLHCLALGLNFTIRVRSDVSGVRCPSFCPFKIKQLIRYPSINKSTFMGLVGSSTICQEVQKESCPPGHPVVGINCSMGWEPRDIREPTPPLLATWGTTWRADLGRNPWIRETSRGLALPRGESSMLLDKKRCT